MIKIKNLTKKYGKQSVLSDVNWKFSDNGLICLLGASGCGKSTLLNILAGFDSDYTGEIVVCGTSINNMNANQLCEYRRDNIGFVFQNYNLLAGYTVIENVLLACEFNNDSKSKNSEKAKALLKRLGISEKINEKIENLSGGQKQRVAIARALINNPSIILADEPTGALDRKNSTEIMELLKEISKERLVLVITHDKKICEFSENTVIIKDEKIVGNDTQSLNSKQSLNVNKTNKASAFLHGVKNFKVHITRYIAISVAISIGILAFMLSLSSGNVMEKSISEFKEKNTAFSNGYIKIEDNENEIFKLLKNDERIENVYHQYIIKNVMLSSGENNETMMEKYPMPKATENMSYGIMPKTGQNQIALSPSLAKKFSGEINKLIGKEIKLTYNQKEYKFTVSGIFNASYDDFFVSSDAEQDFYNTLNNEKVYSISYDVRNFEDVVIVNQMISDKNLKAKTAAKEVETLQNTFKNLNHLFFIVSILILAIGLFISIILLVKLQNSRYREIGLLSSLGFSKKIICAIIVNENVLLSIMAAVLNAVFVGITYLICIILKLSLIITAPQILLSIFGTGIVVILISIIASHKLISTEPAVALRK